MYLLFQIYFHYNKTTGFIFLFSLLVLFRAAVMEGERERNDNVRNSVGISVAQLKCSLSCYLVINIKTRVIHWKLSTTQQLKNGDCSLLLCIICPLFLHSLIPWPPDRDPDVQYWPFFMMTVPLYIKLQQIKHNVTLWEMGTSLPTGFKTTMVGEPTCSHPSVT